eukprot:snap_masked-scaffold638_size121162-processed-gene-0.0 protein:Tk11615 transcript:snap_masked-scaffold638_size121162-processed-gene-0.0-mRNA-1 annotation:"protein tyrosine phosphatase-like protein ptplad1"
MRSSVDPHSDRSSDRAFRAMTPSPFVYWAQNEEHIYLRVDLKNASSHRIEIEEGEIDFTAVAVGAQGSQEVRYHFLIEFFLPIDRDQSTYEVKEREITVHLKKKEPDWWPRLLFAQAKLPWLKIDFDRWTSRDEDSDVPNNEPAMSSEALLKNRYPEVFKQLEKEETGYISESRRKIYLFCYNLFMLCGFGYVFFIMSLRYARQGDEFIPEAYQAVGNVMKMLHLLMFLEVMHPMFGYTKGSIFEAFLQVFGRNFVLLALIESESRMQEKPAVFYLFTVYSIIELVRYPYYMLRVYDLELGLLTWLRYTAWIPLYPAGFVCEGVIALRNIPYFEETEKFSIALPNAWNIAFHFPSMLRVYLLLFFFPMLYTMMNHMYHLRCKKLRIRQHVNNRRKKDDDYEE